MSATTGAFDTLQDVGTITSRQRRTAGTTVYDPGEQTYTMRGGGENIWARSDGFYYAARKGTGDFILTVHGALLGNGVGLHRKWGIMFRAGLDPDAVHAAATVHGDGLTSLQFRPAKGDNTAEVTAKLRGADWIQLERSEKTIVMRGALQNDPLVETGRIEIDLPDEIYIGLFICAHHADLMESVVFRNFRFDVPAGHGVDGYKVPSPSRLELLEVDTGSRRIIYTTASHLEAPNWSRDGSYLLFNQEGRIYRFPLDSAEPELLDTAEVSKSNNDHGISSDGTMLAISSETESRGKVGSGIYVLPIGGGAPTKVTTEVPSYWHGWSIDDSTLVYTGQRDGSWGIYSIPVGGGGETRLTTAQGLDDGPEFSPDGQWIYFNSTRKGLMKIWRMRSDGSHQEQVSSGDLNDWFAHLSPDGTRMVYVSYPSSVPPTSHPRNERVMIREQVVATGEVRVLVHLYGGQGTMNVPSWSPDGKSVAFISYTYGDPSI